MKTILIISPNFPPVNAADMHRVRQSITYFKEFGWNPIVLTVKPEFVEGKQDDLLLKTIPNDIEIIQVDALPTQWTRKIGIGSLALRSLYFYKIKGNQILKSRKIDLIYFSTTMFPISILGSYWKKRFNVPYIIDMQDPWYSDHYLKLPKSQRPAKFWFSYKLNKFLEPIAMKKVSGIIAVSKGYCDMLQQRYAAIQPDSCVVIPFGAFRKDFAVLQQHKLENPFFKTTSENINIVYIGRGGHDMVTSLSAIFMALKKGLTKAASLFSKVRLHFIGTSYAPENKGIPTVEPIARKYDVAHLVKEITNRIPYFESLKVICDADMLLIPGSEDPNYTASKLYPYIMARKPLLAVFNEQSSVVHILRETKAGEAVVFNNSTHIDHLADNILEQWYQMLTKLPFTPIINWNAFEPYTAKEMTRKQANFFNKVIYSKSLLYKHNL